jgi:tripartite-type tricarboxylate transporter receptor subunit TctC
MTCRFVLAALLAAAALMSGAAQAAYPEKPIRIILGYPPGGTTDAGARLIAQELASQMGVPVFVENRPGATGQIGLEATIRSPADGYTLQFLTGPTMVSLQLAGKSVDIDHDLTALSLVFRQGIFIATPAQLPGWESVRDFPAVVAKDRAAPGKLNYGTIGTGSTGHLLGEYLKALAGLTWTHIPYKGQEAAMTALASGEVQVVVGAIANNDFGGRVRLVAVTGASREAAYPSLPTLAEIYPEAVAESWGGMTAPGGLPPDITRRLVSEMKAVLAKPHVAETLRKIYSTLDSTAGADYATFMRDHYNKWGKVIRDNNIKVD